MQKIEWMEQGHLGEAVSTKIEMCLVDAKLKGICVPVRCKDFLSDAYYAEAKNVQTSIWGFRFSPGTIKNWETAPLRMAMRLKAGFLDADRATKMSKLLNAFPLIGKVKVEADGTGSLYIEADNAWSKSPWRISLITMLMRQGMIYDGKMEPFAFLQKVAQDDNPMCHGDGEWVKGTLVPMKQLMEGVIPKKLKDKDSYDVFSGTHECHHGGGIYASWTGKHTG